MEYQYKSVRLNVNDEVLGRVSNDTLNKAFNEGWEYVDKITQYITSTNHHMSGVIVVLRKVKKESIGF